MKNKRILCLLCAAVFALSAAGCGAGVKPSEEDTLAVQAAVEKFALCESFSVDQLTRSTEVATTEGVDYSYVGSKSVKISVINGEDFYMSTVTETEVKAKEGTVSHSTASYILPDNGGYTEYFSDGDQWYQISTQDSSVLPEISAAAFTGSFYVDALSFGRAGEDTLDGGKAVRYEGQIVGQELIDMLDALGYFANSIGSMSENQQAKIRDNLVNDLEPVIVKVWVDAASGYPVRFEVSLTDMLTGLAESISKTLGDLELSEWAITEYEICMVASDFDALTQILPPEEAKDAVIYDIEAGTEQ